MMPRHFRSDHAFAGQRNSVYIHVRPSHRNKKQIIEGVMKKRILVTGRLPARYHDGPVKEI